MALTTYQTDVSEAEGDGNLIAQVTAAIHKAAASVYGEEATTTVAAGSSNAALPQATINVVSTSAFPSSGTLSIAIGGNPVLVAYTGVTATSFTGCSGGTGTLLAGQTVTAYVENHATRAALANRVATGQQNLQPMILSATVFGSLNAASTDAQCDSAVSGLWNLWANA